MYQLAQDLDLTALAVSPKLDREENQKVSREGLPQWTVETLYRPPVGRPEIMLVTIPSRTMPDLMPMQPVMFDLLMIGFWQTDTGSGVYFQAADAKTA